MIAIKLHTFKERIKFPTGRAKVLILDGIDHGPFGELRNSDTCCPWTEEFTEKRDEFTMKEEELNRGV